MTNGFSVSNLADAYSSFVTVLLLIFYLHY